MDFSWPAWCAPLREEAVAVAEEWAGRSAGQEDSWLIGFDPDFPKELAARRWIGMTWPAEEGGGGRSPLERFVVYEALIGHGAPIAGMWFADRQIGPTLLQYATAEQRRRWLPDIIAGQSFWCIGLSEPDAGSDVAGLRTRAEEAPDGSGDWIVNGQKIWTSGAVHADWCYLVARTDREAPRHAGLSEFVVDMRSPGIEVRPVVDMTGDRHFCELYLRDVRVPADHLIGQPNGSFRQLMRQLEHERGGIDRLVSNYALYRAVRESGLLDMADQLTRQEVARLESGYRVGRLLVLRETLRQAPQGFSAATKTFGTEFEQRVARFCSRALGPAGTLWPKPGPPGPMPLGERVARAVAYAPAYTLMGGTTEILRTVLAERVLGLPR